MTATPLRPATEGDALAQGSAAFGTHPVRGRFNAWFFTALDGYINWLTRDHKRAVFSGLPAELVEIGPGVGANFSYLPPGCRLTAIEPNPSMHDALQRRAARRGVGGEELSDVVGGPVGAVPFEALERQLVERFHGRREARTGGLLGVGEPAPHLHRVPDRRRGPSRAGGFIGG